MMLHHLSLPVSDLGVSKPLYDAMFASLGYQCVFVLDDAVGYGAEPGKDKVCLKLQPKAASAGPGFHIAFAAPTPQAVDAFHTAALSFGATDNGGPGPRPDYGPTYYASFIIDPDGHRLEAVFK
jgi:catechol 2,3-dioxygenase-like lactoylglutathione lyase family enzyme